MKKLSILALALSVLAVSCNKEAGKGDPGGAAGEIRVSASVNGITKATTDGAVTTFVNGDKLSLYVWTGDNTAVPADPWINGEVNTYNSETKLWEPKDLMKWKNLTDAHYFLGVYPARAITNFTADSYQQTGFYEKDDLLVATILGDGVKASVAPVPLNMDHLMAKLKVALTLRNQWSGNPEVHVYVKAAATGTVDYLSKTITPGNDIVDLSFINGVGEDHSTLIIPQEGVKEITILVNGSKYVYTHPTSIPLTKGHVTTLPLVVGKDAIVLADEGITFEGWTAGELPEGLGGDAVVAPKVTDLGTIKADYVAQNGYTLTGTLGVNVKISIADGATVTLDGVSINAEGTWSSGDYAGITCEGDATIILNGTNTVKGFHGWYPGIYVPAGKTVTIKGSGSLTASSKGAGAGIGGGYDIQCGNIEIQGGTVTATGGEYAAGIGSGSNVSCGTITISGGTVTATGGESAAGIGSGYFASCGDITITSGVTSVTATKGSYAPNSIGAGDSGTCGTVTVAGTVYPDGVAKSPYIYPEPPKDLADATAEDVGKAIGADGKIYSNADAATKASTTAVAVIAYVGEAGSVDFVSETYKGLAIAMSDANNGEMCPWCDTDQNLDCVSMEGDISNALGYRDGIVCTSDMIKDEHNHPAATAAMSNNGTAAPTGTSNWFLPSIGQWNLIVQGLATKKAGTPVTEDLARNTDNPAYKPSNFNSIITAAGGTGLIDSDYWASTLCDDWEAWLARLSRARAYEVGATCNSYVRSVLAF